VFYCIYNNISRFRVGGVFSGCGDVVGGCGVGGDGGGVGVNV